MRRVRSVHVVRLGVERGGLRAEQLLLVGTASPGASHVSVGTLSCRISLCLRGLLPSACLVPRPAAVVACRAAGVLFKELDLRFIGGTNWPVYFCCVMNGWQLSLLGGPSLKGVDC